MPKGKVKFHRDSIFSWGTFFLPCFLVLGRVLFLQKILLGWVADYLRFFCRICLESFLVLLRLFVPFYKDQNKILLLFSVFLHLLFLILRFCFSVWLYFFYFDFVFPLRKRILWVFLVFNKFCSTSYHCTFLMMSFNFFYFRFYVVNFDLIFIFLYVKGL